MGLLAGVNYDPATSVSLSTGSLLAMTAMDTTNLRLTFTAPANGAVMVRIRCNTHGATNTSAILLGILQSSTVIARQLPLGTLRGTGLATTHAPMEALFTVTGLTGGTSYTWDAAYDVEATGSGEGIKYGGPNNTTANDGFGGIQYEIWTANNLLASTMYDPATLVSKSTASDIAMTAFDTTNLRLTFTPPASGNVMVRMRCGLIGAATYPQILLGVLSGATVIGRTSPIGAMMGTAASALPAVAEAQFIATGLSGSQTWDAAYGVETLVASTNIKYGGPNNTTGNDAYGGFLYEVWGV